MHPSAMLAPSGRQEPPFGGSNMKGMQVIKSANALGLELSAFLQVIGMPARTFDRRRRSNLSDAEADRVARVERIRTAAIRVFGNPDKARRWLTSPNAILGAMPVTLLATDAGTVLVSEELSRIEWGDLA